MRDAEFQGTTRRTVRTPDYEIETCVAYNYAEDPSEYQVRLSPDAQALPAPCRPYLSPDQADQLARDLTAQAATARRRNGTEASDRTEAVRAFLDQELGRDYMSLTEIATEAVKIATGAATFEPDEEDVPEDVATRNRACAWLVEAGVDAHLVEKILDRARQGHEVTVPYASGSKAGVVGFDASTGKFSVDGETEDPAPVDWAGRTFGQLTPAERARVTSAAAAQLQTELQAAAPAIARVLDEAEQDGER